MRKQNGITRAASLLSAVLVAAVAFAAFPASLRAQETLKAGDTISGKLRLVPTRHPNGTKIVVYQIVSDRPLPLAVPDEFCDGSPKTFHLVANDKALKRRLDKLLGKKIAVVADDFFCSHTAWHIGDAVVGTWRFAEQRR